MDALSFESQFLDHLAPVWRLLPNRGRFLVDPTLVERAQRLGIDAVATPRPPHTVSQPKPNKGWNPALVASYGDIKEARRLGYGPFVFLEHGIGQTYNTGPGRGHASYSGGLDREDNALVLVPNEHSASHWRASYAGARVEIVGCPKLDGLPEREYSTRDFTGLESWAWDYFVAAIRMGQRMSAETPRTDTVCVAHAITDASASAPENASSPVICPRPSTTSSADFYYVRMEPPHDNPALVERLTEAVRLAISECTPSCAGYSLPSVISAERLKDALRSRSVGILLSQSGGSIRVAGAPTLRIRTTTFGFASSATSTTTDRAISPGIPSTPVGGFRLRPTLALSFHWPAPLNISGYAGTAVGDYQHLFPALAKEFTVIGHAHPKGDWPERMKRQYARAGIPFVADFEDVCRQADVYVCDNSSTLYEFAATGRPVVVLNQRYWSRKHSVGLRFWDAANVGINVDRPEQLIPAIHEALADAPERQADREDALSIVYGRRTGGAEAAAAAITDWLEQAQEVAA